MSGCLKKDRGCVEDQPQHGGNVPLRRKIQTRRDWSRTTQPRSRIFGQALNRNDAIAWQSERGVHAASTSELNGGSDLNPTLPPFCEVKRRERRGPLQRRVVSNTLVDCSTAWFQLSRTIVVPLLCLALTVSSLRAQLVADGATATLANVTNNITGDVTVGTNGSFTLLTLSDNALLINSLRGVIGRNATARSNEVRLISPTARWQPGSTLYVGSNGAFNRLVISNGAQVVGNSLGNAGIMGQNSSSISNVALVTGAGSVWSNRGALNIGFSGARNQLVVSNGARVHSVDQCYVGLLASSTNNRVTVTGAGSLWSSDAGINFGLNGTGNRLSVLDGGGVLDGVGEINGGSIADVMGAGTYWTNTGTFQVGNGSAGNVLTVSNGAVITTGNYGSVGGSSSSASLNIATVTDSGSMWLINGDLYVGRDGPLNRLFVNNGGLVAATNLFVGFQPTATSNRVAVAGGTLRVTNAAGTGVLDVRRGLVSLRAGSVEADRLFLTNSAASFELAGGTLVTRGAAINNGGGFTVGGSTTNAAIWDVRAGAGHDLGVTLSVGSSTPFNQMLITNGGTLTGVTAYIGSNAGSSSNVALLSGSGSKWTADNLDVGNGGAFNRLIVSDGATVEAFNGALGQNSGSSNNLAVVTGAGSLWSNRNEMYVGYQGGGNQLVISNGGIAFAQATRFLGHASGDISNNTAIVTGAGSRWLGPGNLEVGGPAAFCQLLVTDGGLVQNNAGLIGSGSSANNNLAMVAGAGSVWSNATDLRVGSSGAFNSLVVSNGAFVRNNTGYLGFGLNASNNLAVVTGTGSSWSNISTLLIGNASQGNRLIVSNGAMVRDTSGYVGLDSIGNNLAIVTGVGSLWTNSEDVLVGTFGGGNRLLVSDGGEVHNKFGFVGVDASGSNNVAFVSDAGSVWNNALELYVGYSASRNQLVVSNGGSVFNAGNGFIGFNSTAIANTALVTGVGSFWTNFMELNVGRSGTGNQLVVSNGGTVFTAGERYVGELGGANLNGVVVTGAGSRWLGGDGIYVGGAGSFNRLIVTNGGLAESLAGGIGLSPGANSNQVVVTGGGSTWANELDLIVGDSGSASQLVVSNGARVANSAGILGFFTLSSNNQAVVTGPASIWSNAVSLFVGSSGRASRLIVTNGGTVTAVDRVSLGEFSSSLNNRVVVHDGTLLVTNASLTGTLDVRRGTNVFNAGLIEADVLRMTNALGKFEFNGGTLITRGAAISNGVAFIVGGPGGAPAVWDVRAGPNNHVLGSSSPIIGNDTAFNRLFVTNGALLTGGDGAVGYDPPANSNSVLIAGTGSRWVIGDLSVGEGGSLNSLTMSNGGKVVASGFVYIGNSNGSSNNLALVSDVGSELSATNDDLYVGYSGAGNRLVVDNGGVVRNQAGVLGYNGSSSNNLALVTGAGSLWTNHGELRIGENGGGNQLVVSNGATVFTFANKTLGYFDGSLSNTAIITDPGSAWLGDDSLYVGSDGSFNRLFVRNGARVTSGIATLGGLAGADDNQALVTDAGSSWTNQFDLNVGEGGSRNRLVISNAATLASLSSGFIGRLDTAASNSVIVTDSGSRWLIASNLFVGSNGPAAGLVVANGGRVENSFATLGANVSSSNNWALISGAGSIWSNRNNLLVGGSSRGNSLVVSNGAQVQSDLAILSAGLASSNNEVLVSGTGSIWSNRNQLHVGGLGPASQLVVANGGRVDCNHATIGLNTSASNNQAIVSGAGSFFRVQNTLTIGNSSGGNRVVVSDGASLDDGDGNIGLSGVNNEVVVTGPGTTWTNRNRIRIGTSRGDNQLVISNGAFVFATDVFISTSVAATNNRVVMHGGTLLLGNSPGDGALDVRRGTNVLNAGLIDVARLLVTNSLGDFEFNGGSLVSSGTVINNGRAFTVGNGASAATVTLRSGTHSFANNLVITSNATLVGNGTVTGVLTTQSGGTLSPGASVGAIILSNSPSLQGTTITEISKSGAVLTNDQIQVAGTLTYGGTLVVSNIGPTELAAGDRFPLFSATAYTGDFASITLPPLAFGLTWTNKLAVDGSLEVVSLAPLSPPTVAIQHSNNLLTVSWPSNAFRLETTFALAPPVLWQEITNGISDSGGVRTFTLTNDFTVPNQFFRLVFP